MFFFSSISFLQRNLPSRVREIVESEQELKAVSVNSEEQWRGAFEDMVKLQQTRNYKKQWIYFQVKEKNSPLFVWEMCAQYLGYKPGWAYYQFKEQESRRAIA